MSTASDGPWECVGESFVLEPGFTRTNQTRWEMITGEPRWVFRFRNPQTGQKSKRIYVGIPEFKPRYTAIGIDPLPLHGSLPK